MPISFQNASIPTSFASPSLGSKSGADLPAKMEAIHKAGFDEMELAMPDVLEYGEKITGQGIDPYDFDTIVTVAKEVKALSKKIGVGLMMLQPFSRFEGWKRGESEREREDAFKRARGWMRVMEAADIGILQVRHEMMPHFE